MTISQRTRLFVLATAVALVGPTCVEAPPVIPALASQSLTLRLFVFGADAEDAHASFQRVNKNNPTFTVVPTGGDAELLVGLEKDSAQCVEPTALCSYKVIYRVRTPQGEVLDMAEQSIMSNSDSCSSLCDAALNKVAVEIVGAVSAIVKGGKLPEAKTVEPDAAPEPSAAGSASATPSASAPPGKPGVPPAGSAKPGAAPVASAKPEPAPPPPPPPPAASKPAGKVSLCALGEGPRLPAKEAEKRVAQVDALKRLGIIDQAEFDCLRTAYLNRL